MNWYNGNISEAVKLSQQKNSIFVVYVEGDDELSTKMGKFINEDPRIKKHLESEHFIAIRIETGSEPYMQFAQIYKLVPSPSMFFIGKNGEPLEIATGIIQSADELVNKIESVLQREKSPAAVISVVNFIAEEQAASSSSAPTPKTTTENTTVDHTTADHTTEDRTTADHSTADHTTADHTTADHTTADHTTADHTTENTTADLITTENIATASTNSEIDHAAKLEKARKIIETKRKEKEAEEEKAERGKEIERRKLGKNMQSFKEKQKEEELQKLKEERIRDRLEEQAARQRILEKIASDRAERAHKFSNQSNTTASTEPTKTVQSSIPKSSLYNSDTSRIQFRTPDGQIHVHHFGIKDEFKVIRDYVANTILAQGITDFQLATTFPKREFTASDDSQTISELGLYPSALILIFCNLKNSSKPSAVAQQSGQLLTMFQSLFMTALSPIFAIFGYLKKLIMGDGGNNNANQPPEQPSFGGVSNTIKGIFTGNKTGGSVGAQKRANEEQSSPNDEAKKRNINRLISGGIVNDGASTSNDTKSNSDTAYRRSNVHRLRDLHDSEDENATWNGNSTQQQ